MEGGIPHLTRIGRRETVEGKNEGANELTPLCKRRSYLNSMELKKEKLKYRIIFLFIPFFFFLRDYT